MAPYRVLVVDDSVFMRKIISDLIAEDSQFVVIDTARNGKEAIEKVKLHAPDVVTMDVEMPEMNGLDALRSIMEDCPTPVVMLSSLTLEGAAETIKALELGAVDFIRKPSGSVSLDLFKVKNQLHEKLLIAVKTKRQRAISSLAAPKSSNESVAVRSKLAPPAATERNLTQAKATGHSGSFRQVVAIGTSTGGPRALNSVLSNIPASFPAPILVVQHMPPNFTKSLANRLDEICHIRVVEAENGMQVCQGTAYIAPGGWHMRMRKETASTYRIELTKEDPRSGHRPSVDVMFESLVPLTELKRHAVIMTGMGSDGAKGMFALLKSGAATTIAEAEETCIVYGMPRSAVLMEAATCVAPLPDIPHRIIQAVLADTPTS